MEFVRAAVFQLYSVKLNSYCWSHVWGKSRQTDTFTSQLWPCANTVLCGGPHRLRQCWRRARSAPPHPPYWQPPWVRESSARWMTAQDAPAPTGSSPSGPKRESGTAGTSYRSVNTRSCFFFLKLLQESLVNLPSFLTKPDAELNTVPYHITQVWTDVCHCSHCAVSVDRNLLVKDLNHCLL